MCKECDRPRDAYWQTVRACGDLVRMIRTSGLESYKSAQVSEDLERAHLERLAARDPLSNTEPLAGQIIERRKTATAESRPCPQRGDGLFMTGLSKLR